MHLAFGWLSESSAEKTSCPKNFLEIALTSYCHTIGQLNNAFSILGFSLAGKESIFCSFHLLADKTKNSYRNNFSRTYETHSKDKKPTRMILLQTDTNK